MTFQPLDAGSAAQSSWSALASSPAVGSSAASRSYLVAAMRAGVIALVLLGILALVVLF
jgi:hypothetical protein